MMRIKKQPATILFYLFLIICTGCYSAYSNNAITPEKLIVWRNWSDAMTKATASNKQTLIFVNAPWCPWCRKMDHEAFKSKRVIELVNRGYIPISINMDTNPAFVRAYNIRSVPTIIILDGKHQIVKTLSGYQSESEMIDALESASQ